MILAVNGPAGPITVCTCGCGISPPHHHDYSCPVASGSPPDDAIDADDVREAKLDADAFGRVFPEIKIALLVQVMRVLLRTPSIPAPAKRLIAETLDKIRERR